MSALGVCATPFYLGRGSVPGSGCAAHSQGKGCTSGHRWCRYQCQAWGRAGPGWTEQEGRSDPLRSPLQDLSLGCWSVLLETGGAGSQHLLGENRRLLLVMPCHPLCPAAA